VKVKITNEKHCEKIFDNDLDLSEFLIEVVKTSGSDELKNLLQAVYPEAKIECTGIGWVASNIKRMSFVDEKSCKTCKHFKSCDDFVEELNEYESMDEEEKKLAGDPLIEIAYECTMYETEGKMKNKKSCANCQLNIDERCTEKDREDDVREFERMIAEGKLSSRTDIYAGIAEYCTGYVDAHEEECMYQDIWGGLR